MFCPLRPLEPERVIGLRNLCICDLERLLMPTNGRVPLSVYTGQIDII
jgi:hypothetical protein